MESYDLLNRQHVDNYNKPLHLYPYLAIPDANSVQSQLDVTITKSARNIKLHYIGNWTDDSYFLMGQAEFLLKEYEKSANTFKYIVDKYHPDNVAKELAALKKKKPVKRKKKKRKKRKKKSSKNKSAKSNISEELEPEEPINYGIKHKPIRYEAMLWLAKSLIELKSYDDAGFYLRQLENDLQVPYKLRPLVQAVHAYYWVVQNEFDKAIEPLQSAIELTRKKSVKNRYVYLLAQIYQMQGSNELAMENFFKVLRLKPSYEMEFNARLNMVKNAANSNNNKYLDPEIALKRMLRDSKNEEYKDQIHFALAQLYVNRGNSDEAINSLKSSILFSRNNMQKTEGCLMLADLYFKADQFVESYAYYDTTLIVMEKSDERHPDTDSYKRRLEGLAKNLAVYLDKDSMLIVGSWSREKQEKWAIKNMDQEAQQKAAPTASNLNMNAEFTKGKSNSISSINSSRSGGQNSTGEGINISEIDLQKSKFALYNPTIKKKGEREFEKRWGQRQWIDKWRISNNSDESTEINDINDVAATPKTQAEIDAYLKKKGVPSNEKDREKIIKQICQSIFLAAEHYREDLNRDDLALALLDELFEKYPENDFAVEALFLAYNIYAEKNNISKTNFYKNKIISKYPDSNIARVLSDPSFANAQLIKYQKINQYYDEAYALVRNGKAELALNKVRSVPEEFGNDYEMKARFALLEAMCIGGMKGEKDYIKSLNVVITSFPETNEEKQAKEMIKVLNSSKGNTKNVIEEDIGFMNGGEISPYQVNMNTKHLVLIVFNKDASVNKHRAPISTFNSQNYPNSRLSVSSILLDASIPCITIRSFQNGEKAMQYVVDVRSNKDFIPEEKNFQVYAISQQNYNISLSTQKFYQYVDFFSENYR